MPRKRWFCDDAGFRPLPAETYSLGTVSGPWRAEVEFLPAKPPDAPFVTLARSSRITVWHSNYPDERFVLRIPDKASGDLVRVILTRSLAMQLATTIIGHHEEPDQELEEAA